MLAAVPPVLMLNDGRNGNRAGRPLASFFLSSAPPPAAVLSAVISPGSPSSSFVRLLFRPLRKIMRSASYIPDDKAPSNFHPRISIISFRALVLSRSRPSRSVFRPLPCRSFLSRELVSGYTLFRRFIGDDPRQFLGPPRI